MKMKYAGAPLSPTGSPEFHRYNCTRNKACQKEFFNPVSGLCDFMLYFDLPFFPSSYSIEVVSTCSAENILATVINYVVAENTKGFYAVFGGLSTFSPLPQYFYLKVTFFDDSNAEAVFYSDDFERTTCESLTKISSCYNSATIGSDAFDSNGVYYGFPVGSNVLGDPSYRYFHFIMVRKATITGNSTKLSFTTFNARRVYKTAISKQFSFYSEPVPEYYKDHIVAVIARGNIQINKKNYKLAEEVNLQIDNEDSKLWLMDLPLVEDVQTIFSCKFTNCLFDPCVPKPIDPPLPEDECCTPTLISATANILSSGCVRYDISGINNEGEVNYTECDGTETGMFFIGGASISVCSIVYPVGNNVLIEISSQQDC